MEGRNGVIIGYVLQVEGPDGLQETTTDDTYFTWDDLKPFTSYRFSVCARTQAGIGPVETISSITPEDGKIIKDGLSYSVQLAKDIILSTQYMASLLGF